MPNDIDIEGLRALWLTRRDVPNHRVIGFLQGMADQIPALLDEIERLRGERDRWYYRSGEQSDRADALEQRLRIVADPDSAERDALKAQGDELEAKLHAAMDAEQAARLEIDALKARVAELEEQIELDVDDDTEREIKAAYDIDTLKAEVSALKAKLEQANSYLENFSERDKTLTAKLELVREQIAAKKYTEDQGIDFEMKCYNDGMDDALAILDGKPATKEG